MSKPGLGFYENFPVLSFYRQIPTILRPFRKKISNKSPLALVSLPLFPYIYSLENPRPRFPVEMRGFVLLNFTFHIAFFTYFK